MARWFRQRVSPTTAERPQRCPAITLEPHWLPSPCHWLGSASCVNDSFGVSTMSRGRRPWARRRRLESVPVVVLGIGTPASWHSCRHGRVPVLDCLLFSIGCCDVREERDE